MYFIVFDHDVMANQYYVRMCRLLREDGSQDGIEGISSDLDALTHAGHYSDLLTSFECGTFINRYILGFDVTPELETALQFYITEKLDGTPFAQTNAQNEALIEQWAAAGHKWLNGWHALLHCWSFSATSDTVGAPRTGWVSQNTKSPGLVCNMVGENTADNHLIDRMYEAAVLILDYLVANNDQAAVRVITTKYPFAIPQHTSQSVACSSCGKVLRDTSNAYKALNGDILCDSCWYNYLHYPTTLQDKFNKAEFVISIANGYTDPRLYRKSDLKDFKAGWEAAIKHPNFTIDALTAENIVNKYNAKIRELGYINGTEYTISIVVGGS